MRVGAKLLFLFFVLALGERSDAAILCGKSLSEIVRLTKDNLPENHIVAVAVLVKRDGKIMFGKRKGSRGSGSWGFPGGKLDKGESIRAAARRELFEETNLVARKLRFREVREDQDKIAGVTYITFIFEAEIGDQEPVIAEPKKCDAWAWFSPSNWPAPVFEPNIPFLASLDPK